MNSLKSDALLAGIDNLSFDNRKFSPSKDDIERICNFFSIGKLKSYKNEKNIVISHSNFFVFVSTAQGKYALKFYPPDTAQLIAIEYATNRLLVDQNFQTPIMHAGTHGRPFIASNGRLATCYSFISGRPGWQCIKQQATIQQINTALLSLKNILSTSKARIPIQKQDNLLKTVNALAQESRLIAPYDQKIIIDRSLLDICQTYQDRQPLFIRQKLHNNINLTNFLIYKKKIHLLDLSHVKEDYYLADLVSLVISCLFFNIPMTTIKNITQDYFTQHKMDHRHFYVLNVLIKTGLIKEYLKNIRREKSISLPTNPPRLEKTYLSQLRARQKSIMTQLKK